MKLAVLVAVSAAAALSVAILPNGPTRAASTSVSFSAAQAAAGAKAYTQSCASCHGVKLSGVSAPALAGSTSGIAQQSVVEVYEYVSQQMPMTAPGSLSKAQYLSIVAYILQKNGHTAGTRRLTEAAATTATASVATKP